MSTVGATNLHWGDVLVVICYFVAVLGVGLWSAKRSSRGSISGYFLASRSMHWIPVGASLFASNIGSGHFIGLVGSGAASGIGIAGFELNAMFILILLGWVFVPVYMAAGVFTMPEYLKLRFGGQRIRVYLSILALLLYIFTKISADLFAGALFIKSAMSWKGEGGLYLAILILLIIAGVFTIGGGLTAVIWTDFVQTILMIIGAFILMVKSFIAVGGYNALVDEYFRAEPNVTAFDSNNKSCGGVRDDAMHLFRNQESDLPWTGMVFGLTVSAVWYWCSDQVIVQRALSAKNMIHAKSGCIFASYLKFLPMFLLVFPGMAARVLFTNEVACAHPDVCEKVCDSRSGCSNIAYILLVLRLLPPGLTGLMLAVMLAALMSSLTSIFNSSSTIFTIDIWTRFRKHATETELLIVGRCFVVVLIVISIIWIPIIQASPGSQLFVYIQSITSYLAPPICAVYVLAVFVPRVNEPGAFWGLMGGLVVGMIRFILEFSYTIPPCGSGEVDPRPEFVKKVVGNVNYLHFGCILFLLVCMITICVSLVTKPIPEACLFRLTFWSRNEPGVRMKLEDDEAETIVNGGSSAPSNGAVDLSQNESNRPAPSLLRRVFNVVCGVSDSTTSAESSATPEMTAEQKAAAAADFLYEPPFWKKVVNINAVIVMSFAVFVYAYWA